jgi:hypothetical protein
VSGGAATCIAWTIEVRLDIVVGAIEYVAGLLFVRPATQLHDLLELLCFQFPVDGECVEPAAVHDCLAAIRPLVDAGRKRHWEGQDQEHRLLEWAGRKP